MNDLAISPEELSEVFDPELEAPASEAGSQTAAHVQADGPGAGLPESSLKDESRATARPVQFAPLQPQGAPSSNTNLDLLLGVTLQITVELGRTKKSIQEILQLGPGSVVELDKLAGEPVDVLVNNRLMARGEVVVIDDRFGVRITDVLPPAQRINSLQ